MSRDKDKDNASWRGRRERTPGDRSGSGREGEKRFFKRSSGGQRFEGGRDEDRGRHQKQQDARRFRRRDEREERKDFRRDHDRPRKDFDRRERGDEKPWRRRDEQRRHREGAQEMRGREDRPKFGRPRLERREQEGKAVAKRPGFGVGSAYRERNADTGKHLPREEARPKKSGERMAKVLSRSGLASGREQEGKAVVKRPSFGGRGAYRERKDATDKRPPREEARPRKTGERIAKVLARAGLASRRDAEEWIVQGRVSVNGRVINSPALDVTANDAIAVDGRMLPPRERTRLFLYHKPRRLVTTHADPEGRPTVFDNLPEGLPRLISVGRLDFNTEGLLLLTNDGGLARVLELPETGWLRRYRVRAHGETTQAQLDELKNGIEVDGVKYGPIDASLEREQGTNVWLVFAIREGKNREVRNVLSHLGLEVNRLIRVSFGPFQLGELAEGEAVEVKSRVLREQLGDKIVAQAGADFTTPAQAAGDDEGRAAGRGEKSFKPSGKSALIADRKGRRVLVQRTGGEEARARNEADAHGYGPLRRPKRGYHGKRDLKPREV